METEDFQMLSIWMSTLGMNLSTVWYSPEYSKYTPTENPET